MTEIIRHKAQISATVSPRLKRICEEVAKGNTGDFANTSDLVSQALLEFLTKYEEAQNKKYKLIKGRDDFFSNNVINVIELLDDSILKFNLDLTTLDEFRTSIQDVGLILLMLSGYPVNLSDEEIRRIKVKIIR